MHFRSLYLQWDKLVIPQRLPVVDESNLNQQKSKWQRSFPEDLFKFDNFFEFGQSSVCTRLIPSKDLKAILI